MTLNKIDTVRLLRVLIDSPFMFSFIEADYADELEDLGYFDLLEFTVTEQGKAFADTVAV